MNRAIPVEIYYRVFTKQASLAGAGKWLWRAGPGSIGKGVESVGKLIKSPGKTLKEGWQGMSPTLKPGLIKRDIIVMRAQGASAHSIAAEEKRLASMMKNIKKNPHLAESHKPKGYGPKALAERASRAGWAGQGKYTKYVPIGEKSMLTGFTAPTAVDAVRGKAGGEDIGREAGGALGWVAASRNPIVGAMLAYEGVSRAGGYLGKKILPRPPATASTHLGVKRQQVARLGQRIRPVRLGQG